MIIEKLTRSNLLKLIHFDESIFGERRLKYQKLSSMLDNQNYTCYVAVTPEKDIIGYLIYFNVNKSVLGLVADTNCPDYKNIITKLLKKNNKQDFQIEVEEENLTLQIILRDIFNLRAIPLSTKDNIKKMTRKNKNGKSYYLMGLAEENAV